MPSPPETSSTVLSRYPNVTVIGAGVIGSSWAALFLAHGLKVVVNDPRPDIEAVVKADLERFAPTLRALGLAADDLARHLRFEPDLERAVADADVVQENGPERIEFKQDAVGAHRACGAAGMPCCCRRARRGRPPSRRATWPTRAAC